MPGRAGPALPPFRPSAPGRELTLAISTRQSSTGVWSLRSPPARPLCGPPPWLLAGGSRPEHMISTNPRSPLHMMAGFAGAPATEELLQVSSSLDCLQISSLRVGRSLLLGSPNRAGVIAYPTTYSPRPQFISLSVLSTVPPVRHAQQGAVDPEPTAAPPHITNPDFASDRTTTTF